MTKKKKIIVTAVSIAVAVGIVTAVALQRQSNKIPLVTVEKAATDLKNYSFNKHENMKFDCDVLNTDFEKVYTFSVDNSESVGDEEKKQCTKLIELFTGQNVDETEYENRNNSWYYGVDDNGNSTYGGEYYPGGTFTVWDNDNPHSYSETSVYKTLKASDDLSSEEYLVGGEMYKVTDAIDYCNDYIEKNLKSFFNENEELKLTEVVVIKDPAYTDFAYVMHYIHMIDGVAVDDAGFTTLENDYMHESFFEITVSKVDKIELLNNRCYYKAENMKEVKKIVPLSEAENILSDYLAPNVNYNISECELKYCCRTHADAETLEYKPMWSFTLTQYSAFNGYTYLSYMTAYVDAVSGDVVLYDMNNQQIYE
jgi:hypothetical protein